MLDKFLGFSLVVLMSVLFLIIVYCFGMFIYAFTGGTCNDMWRDYEHQYSITGGCQVMTDTGWVSEDNIRITMDGTLTIGGK